MPNLCVSCVMTVLHVRLAIHEYRIFFHLVISVLHFIQASYRSLCTQVIAQSEGERRIAEKIQSQLNVSKIEVEDISGTFSSFLLCSLFYLVP